MVAFWTNRFFLSVFWCTSKQNLYKTSFVLGCQSLRVGATDREGEFLHLRMEAFEGYCVKMFQFAREINSWFAQLTGRSRKYLASIAALSSDFELVLKVPYLGCKSLLTLGSCRWFHLLIDSVFSAMISSELCYVIFSCLNLPDFFLPEHWMYLNSIFFKSWAKVKCCENLNW